MINYEAIEDAVYTIVAPILSPGPLIFARQADPAPNSSTEPYTTILLNNLVQVGREQVGRSDSNGMTPVKLDYRLVIDFQSYGEGARNQVAKLQAFFNRPSVVDQFLVAGLAMVRQPTVLDIPKVINTQWEEVALIAVTFHLSDVNDDDTSFIGSVVDLTGIIEDPAGNTVDTIQITITDP